MVTLVTIGYQQSCTMIETRDNHEETEFCSLADQQR